MPAGIKGIDHPKAISSVDALLGKRELGNNVTVIGGGLVGCECALDLAQKGKKVTLVELLDDLLSAGKPVPKMNAMMLKDLIADNHIEVKTGCAIEAVTDKGAVIKNNDGSQEEIAADDVIIAIGFKSENSLAKELYGKVQMHTIGDSRSVATIMNAVWDAYEIARNL